MSGHSPYGSTTVPDGVSATGVQRALGERRRQRSRERGGQIDLDATMSSWAQPDPPSRPRPVVRPRQAHPGTATVPGLPTPHVIMMRAVDGDPSGGEAGADTASRRRRRETAPSDTGPTVTTRVAPADPPGQPPPGQPPGQPSAERRRSRARQRPPDGASEDETTVGIGRAAVAGAAAAGAVAWVTSSGGPGDAAPRDAAPARPAPVPPAPEPPAAPAARSFPSRMPPRTRQTVPPGASPDLGSPARPDTDPAPAVETPSPGTSGDPFTAFSRSPSRSPAGTRADAPPMPPENRSGPPRQAHRSTPAGEGPPAGGRSAFEDASASPFGARRPGLPRSRVLLVVAAAAAVLLVVVAAVAVRSDSGAEAAPDLVPSATPQQDTVVVSLLADDGTIARSVLLAEGPTAGGQREVVSVLTPGELMVQVPDQGTFSLSQAVTVEPAAVDRGVEDAIGVRVDGTWAMAPDLLADLVDAVGGVEVDVATPITIEDVTVPVGPSQLTGAQAAAYSRAIIDEEGPDGALARFGQVVLGLVAALPMDAGDVTQTLSTVDRDPATTITSERLSQTLAQAATTVGDGEAAEPVRLPTQPVGDDDTLVAVDDEALTQIVDEQLPGARLPVAQVGALDVFVGNAVGTPGLVTAARDRLVEAGFRFAGGGTAETVEEQTQVLLREDTPENRARGEAVAAALGVSADALRVRSDFGDGVPEETDVIVWLEQDFADAVGDGGS